MIWHTLKIFQHWVQNIYSVSDFFEILCIKRVARCCSVLGHIPKSYNSKLRESNYYKVVEVCYQDVTKNAIKDVSKQILRLR